VNITLPADLGVTQAMATEVVAYVLVLGRVGPLFLLAPVLSATLIARRAKYIAAMGFALALTPLAEAGRTVPTDPLAFALTLAREVGIGISFALALGVLVAAVTAGASLLDTLVGFSFGALVDPVTGNQNAILGQVYSIFAMMIFLLSGGIGYMVLGLARTYQLVPLGTFPSPARLGALALSSLVQVPLIGLELVAPVLVAVVVADAAFGIVARAVPQMNVLVMALPVKVLLAFAVIAASMPFVGVSLQNDLLNSLNSALSGLVP
jgi:flagellar biosynthetic protein FliR